VEINLNQRTSEKTVHEETVTSEFLFLKPSSFPRRPKIIHSSKKKLSLTTYSQPGLFKNLVSSIYTQMLKTYGNIPLWVEYSVYPHAVSWNLRLTQATHKLFVYGDKEVTEEFMHRFSDTTQCIQSKNNSYFSSFGTEQSQSVDYEPINLPASSLLPSDTKKSYWSGKKHSDLFSMVGLVAGVTGLLLEICLLNKKKQIFKQNVTRQEALNAAFSSISSMISKKPELKTEKRIGDKWEFVISGYAVLVNKKGQVEKIRKVTEK
jgi:hypothetical protein